ncbi:hypothetical protein PRIPAC_75255 [Pristionchus pacificus]|uniref:Uncharacterized protein n=1 Tax=Pristionchus pacificus TaxID=54126 RepID=A0A2A6CSJ8_PRIPA|nr:hypothetical protein PRIPAC_75255 [Pristionchus pacificus]|eukprot:PDM81088.1 hypothetical protein PRIPAC_36091 [Pristionchus pacificus]
MRLLLATGVWLASLTVSQLPPVNGPPQTMAPTPAIRIRLNRGLFDQASSIASGLVEYQISRISLPSTQQCFTEGCVQIQNLRITNFRQPQGIYFGPIPPNQLVLRLTNFDFFITGNLGGSIQVIIQFPVGGTIYVTGRGLSVTTTFDLQKSVDDEPYLRMLTCGIEGGTIEARVAGMGIFTDTVNNKYGNMMSMQTRRNLQTTMCRHMQSLVDQHFSDRLRKLPRTVSVKDLTTLVISVRYLFDTGTREEDPQVAAVPSASIWPFDQQGGGFTQQSQPFSPQMGPFQQRWAMRRTRQAAKEEEPDYMDEAMKEDGKKAPAVAAAPKKSWDLPESDVPVAPFTAEDLHKFFNVERMRHLFVDVNMLDASATTEDFSIGISGNVYSSRSLGESPFVPPYPFRLPQNPTRRAAEVIVSSYTINSLLFHAHRTNALLFHVDSSTPGVGNLLKTTCSIDEICISDQIEEVGQRFPGKNLELIIRTLEEPSVEIEEGAVIMKFSGKTMFFVQGSRKKVGSISFTTVFEVQAQTIGGRLVGTLAIRRLVFHRDVDFFGLSARDLEGFRNSAFPALPNFVNRVKAA